MLDEPIDAAPLQAVSAAPHKEKRKNKEPVDTNPKKKMKLTPATITKEVGAQREFQEELDAILLHKMNFHLRRYLLNYTPTNATEKECLEVMAKYKVVSECREEVLSEEVVTDSQKALHLLKMEALEGKRVFVEGLRTADFEKCRKQLFARDEFERKRLRDEAPNAKFVDEIITADLKEKWNVAKMKFIKCFYYWQGFRTEYAMDCFVAYMDHCKASLFNKILELADGVTLKPPKQESYKLPLIGGAIPDEETIRKKIEECAEWLEKNDRPNLSSCHQ